MTRQDSTRRASRRRPGLDPSREDPAGSRAREALLYAQPRSSARSRRVRPHPLPIVAGLVLLLAAAAGIAAMAPRGGDRSAAQAWSAVATTTASAEAAATGPTPAYATFRKVRLLLPVPPEAITCVAFHQSSFSDTYKVTPLVAIGSTSDAKARATAEREGGEPQATAAGPQSDEDGVWTGSALQVWRTNVNGRMNSALDCGAKPGTPVFAPLSGTVMRVRSYKLYYKYADYEIQIKPDAWNDVDLFILHVTGPLVKEGDRVTAGVTQVASVRDLASKLSGMQLRSYTTEGGNHTHIQLNRIPKPDQEWLLGEDPPGFKRQGS